MKRKHGFLLLISACIPGCGQMYQGYMKRGLSLMLAFFGIFALSVSLNMGTLSVLMLPVWLYTFFDTYNLRSQMDAETAAPDEFLFGLSDLDSEKIAALCRKRHSIIGWALVALGAFALWKRTAAWLVKFLSQFFVDIWWLHRFLIYDIPQILTSVLIIALGLWFIRGPKAKPSEDIPAFTPPTEEEPRDGE